MIGENKYMYISLYRTRPNLGEKIDLYQNWLVATREKDEWGYFIQILKIV